MTLSKREKLLALVVGILGVVMVGTVVGGLIVNPIQRHYTELEAARQAVAAKEEDLQAANVAQKKMEDWRPRSLASDAQGLYNDWLLKLAEKTFPFTVVPPARQVGDTPFQIDQREIAFHLDDVDRADVHTLPASGASFSIGLSEEIGGHQNIPRDLLSPNGAHRPTTASTTITGMFDALSRIVDEMNQAGFLRLFDYLEGFSFCNLPSNSFFDQIFC